MTSKLELDFITLDVFTQVRYTGNPLAIVKVPPSKTLTQQQKQMIAREFNYSETVILHELQEVDHEPQWHIDIFLTTAEIPFAGHPAVGTAGFLGKQLLDSGRGNDQVKGTLITKAGPVAFAYLRQSNTAQCDVPHDVHLHPRILITEDAQNVGLPRVVYENIVNKPPFVSLVKGVTYTLVQLPTENVLGAIPSALDLLKSHDGLDEDWAAKGSTVGFFFFVKVGQADEGLAILRTRMIHGSLEDPATGSASSTLAAYLALHDTHKERESAANEAHKFQMVQGVEMGRKSVIGVEVIAKHCRIDKITLAGSSVSVMEGSLVI
jgi:predicted PhzF superfamily epimerase YddE/YHI9